MLDESSHDGEEDFIFSEYAIDDTLDPLNRLLNYHSSGFSLQRLVLLRELNETAQFAGYKQSAEMIVPLLAGFTSDCEPVVRQMLVEQLPEFANFFLVHGGGDGYEFLLNKFLPIGFELLVDKNVEVGASALESLKKLAHLVRPEHVQLHLLNVVVMLAHDERAEDYRVVAARLFNELADIFGPECCLKDVLPELELLAIDSNFSVRAAVASNLGNVAKVVTDPYAETVVLPMYVNLCQDEVWGVRKACAQSVEALSTSVSPRVRATMIVPTFCNFFEDTSRWVRNGAYELLGRLIHSLQSEDVSPALLKLYTDMAFKEDNGDTEYSDPCAFTFPAVVQVLGRSRWEEVSDAYATLLKDVKWKVRKSLAHSLHELARILGRDITEAHLVSALELLLRDLDEVRVGVVLHMDAFLQIVGPKTRERLVPLLCNAPLESENWRLRNVVAQRIGDVGVLLDPTQSAALGSVLSLVLRLLDDSVMEVRRSTYRSAAVLLTHVADAGREATYGEYVDTLVELAEKTGFRSRLIFPYIVTELAKLGAAALAEKYFAKGLLRLAHDEVSNVRLAVRAAMQELGKADPHFLEMDRNQQILNALLEKDEHDGPSATYVAQNATSSPST